MNAWRIAEEASSQLGPRVAAYFAVHFTTGPGVTGWIMTTVLGIMAWFAAEKRKKVHFERFWYSHHLFIVFFISWQLHGVSGDFEARTGALADPLPGDIRCSA